MYIDTHTHLYDERYKDRAGMINRAVSAGVTKLIMPNCDVATIAPMLQTEDAHPGVCYSMMGLHPCYVDAGYEKQLNEMSGWLDKRSFVAIGEIGLDYHWDLTFVPEQKIAFSRQIDWALSLDLPIVIHARESTRDAIEIVREKQNGKLKGIFHCFAGTVEEAQEVAALGLYMGIGGVVTYKKSNLAEVIKAVSLDSVVLETDAPYLAPVPFRGKPNESGYIPYIADAISNIMEVSTQVVADITSENAVKIFGDLK